MEVDGKEAYSPRVCQERPWWEAGQTRYALFTGACAMSGEIVLFHVVYVNLAARPRAKCAVWFCKTGSVLVVRFAFTSRVTLITSVRCHGGSSPGARENA